VKGCGIQKGGEGLVIIIEFDILCVFYLMFFLITSGVDHTTFEKGNGVTVM